jgi:hypothetical protein
MIRGREQYEGVGSIKRKTKKNIVKIWATNQFNKTKQGLVTLLWCYVVFFPVLVIPILILGIKDNKDLLFYELLILIVCVIGGMISSLGDPSLDIKYNNKIEIVIRWLFVVRLLALGYCGYSIYRSFQLDISEMFKIQLAGISCILMCYIYKYVLRKRYKKGGGK